MTACETDGAMPQMDVRWFFSFENNDPGGNVGETSNGDIMRAPWRTNRSG